MPISGVILKAGEVLVIDSDPTIGILAIDNTIKFAYVDSVSDFSSFVAGDYVFYRPENGRKIMYGSTIYILIKETNISGKLPPPS